MGTNAGYYEPDADGKRPPESLYGSLKMWAHLQRQGIPVARRTVERIMRHNGWRGVTRARRAPRTTEPDPAAARAPDLVGRQWRVAAPNLLVVADFTYVPMTRGFGYTAFVVDAYAGVIPGWECSLVKDTGFVERALRHAVAFRACQGHPFDDAIHHSDAGSQYTAIHYSETLMLEGLIPSVGTVGDALDNALCETTIGLYKEDRLIGQVMVRLLTDQMATGTRTLPPSDSQFCCAAMESSGSAVFSVRSANSSLVVDMS